MIEDSENKVLVRAFETDPGIEPWAEVDVLTYPDGSPMNHLDAEEMKQVADMLYAVAEKMEGWGDD